MADYFVDENLYSDYKIIAPKDNSLWEKDFDSYRKIFTDSAEIKYRFNKINLLFKYLNWFRYGRHTVTDKGFTGKFFGHNSPTKSIFNPAVNKTSYKFIAYFLTKNILETKIKDMDKIEKKIEEFVAKTANAK